MRRSSFLLAALATALLPPPCHAATPVPRYGAQLEGFDYPYPISRYDFASQHQPLQMS